MVGNYNLQRFIDRQKEDFPTALREIQNGRKVSHWMWWIFPQLKELGYSYTSKEYGISGIEEARAYLQEPLLRQNMLTICHALLDLESNDAYTILGSPDNMKLRSSMTLFAEANPEEVVFADVLKKFYEGKKDGRTLHYLGKR